MAEAAVLEEYFVTEDCIACDACCDDFPDIFIMNADHTRAIATNTSPVGKFNPWDIINDCPVDAIKLVNMPMPAMPEGMKKKKEEAPAEVDTGNWMERWLAVADEAESQWERMKRYGMASTVEDAGDRYIVRFDMPAKVPNHKYKFKWGLPEEMPPYDCKVTIKGSKAKIRCKLTDPKILKLSGWVNSFPEGFLREIQLDAPLKGHKESYDSETRVLEVVLEKDLSAIKPQQAA